MIHETIKNYLTFFVVLLLCGGGCMYMPYVPAQQTDLALVGLDEHTRARLEGQANSRPDDPEPTPGLNGRLGIVALQVNWQFGYGHTANILPSERTNDRLMQLDGIEHVYNAGIDLSEYYESLGRGEEPPKIDFKKMLLEDAQQQSSDLLLIYTTGHNAKSLDLTLGIGQIFLLGFCPTVVFSAEASTTAILMDAKTGFIYAATEGQGDDAAIGIGWGQAGKKAKAATNAAEEAFDQVVDQLEEAWPVLQGIYR